MKFAINVATTLNSVSINIPKIPFYLISDMLENQTVSNAESTWDIVELMTDSLTKPELFSKGFYLLFHSIRKCSIQENL